MELMNWIWIDFWRTVPKFDENIRRPYYILNFHSKPSSLLLLFLWEREQSLRVRNDRKSESLLASKTDDVKVNSGEDIFTYKDVLNWKYLAFISKDN